MLRIPKLEILSLLPNPFLTPVKNNRQILKSVSVTSLVEITTRLVLSNNNLNEEKNIPMDIMHRLSFISPVNTCEQCKKVFLNPDVVEVHWKTPLTTRQPVPVLYRFCSLLCSDLYSS
jgi:hypothetical protein